VAIAGGDKLAVTLLTMVGYFSGAIPCGVLVGRMWGFDPRSVGSGNIGTTNVARAGGKSAAAVTLVADVFKGFMPVEVTRWVIGNPPSALAVVGLATFAGSIASIFLKFRGGRGVATSLGVWLALAPISILPGLAVFGAVIAMSRIVSLASILAALALPPAAAALNQPRAYILLAIVMAASVLLRHSENIARLIRGEEPTIASARAARSGD